MVLHTHVVSIYPAVDRLFSVWIDRSAKFVRCPILKSLLFENSACTQIHLGLEHNHIHFIHHHMTLNHLEGGV